MFVSKLSLNLIIMVITLSVVPLVTYKSQGAHIYLKHYDWTQRGPVYSADMSSLVITYIPHKITALGHLFSEFCVVLFLPLLLLKM